MTAAGVQDGPRVTLDPFSPAFHHDPYPVYRRLRDDEPCYRNDVLNFYALSRYDDVLLASQQPLLYSSAQGTMVEPLDTSQMVPMMIFMDPPEHDTNRRVVVRGFTPRAVASLEPYIRGLAVRLLDRLRERGGGDFVEEFSAVLPTNVVMELIGVPEPDRDRMRRLVDASLERTEEPPFIPMDAIKAMLEAMAYWQALVPQKRAHPADDLISRLCKAEAEGERLTDAEIVGFCSLIGSAGTETLTKLLANALVLFHRHPDQWAIVRDQPAAIPGAVEEVLRFWAPSQYQGRTLTDEVTLHGVTMPAGSRVLLLTGSANRDGRQYPNPDRFDVTRPIRIPIGFGHGTHFCLGAALARLEARVALEEFAARFPQFEVDESRAVRVRMSNVHGYASVPFSAT